MAFSLNAQPIMKNVEWNYDDPTKDNYIDTLPMFAPIFHQWSKGKIEGKMDTIPIHSDFKRDTALCLELNELRHERKELRMHKRELEAQIFRTSMDWRGNDKEVRVKYSRNNKKIEYLNFKIFQWQHSGYECMNRRTCISLSIWKDEKTGETKLKQSRATVRYERRKPDLSFEAYMDYIIKED